MAEAGVAIRGGVILREGGKVNVADPVAGCDGCCGGCPCAAPTTLYTGLGLVPGLDVTLTWTGAQATRLWGEDFPGSLIWTNGETKTLCGGYLCQRRGAGTTGCSPSYGFEEIGIPDWLFTAPEGGLLLQAFYTGCQGNGFLAKDKVQFKGNTTLSNVPYLNVADNYYLTFVSHFGGSSRSNISTDNIGLFSTAFTQLDEFLELSGGHFGGTGTGQITDTNGITYTWTPATPACPNFGTLC